MARTDKVWEIPEPNSVHEVTMVDGAVIALRHHGKPSGLRIVLSHGNGLAIDLYYPFWSQFMDDCELIVYDLRNHGWNSVSSQRQHNIATFANDHDQILAAIDDCFGKKPKIGIFHSVSALAALLSPNCSSQFDALILFDPPMYKPDDFPESFDKLTRRYVELIQQRVFQFNSIEEYVEFLQYIPSLGRTVPGVLDLYARTTLRKSPAGDCYELRCPRDYEAQIANFARIFAIYVNLDGLHCPTKVIGADPTLPSGFWPTFDLGHIMTLDYDFLPDATHLLQLEKPEACAAMVREFLETHGCLNS